MELMIISSVSDPGFPEHETRFLATFYYPKLVFFQLSNPGILKSWNCCCIKILAILITLKMQIGAYNGQISMFELSTIIMRHEVRVLLGDHRKFVVSPLIFWFNWPIQTDRDVVLHIIGVVANFCPFAKLIKYLPRE